MKFKNISGEEQAVIGVGVVPAGEVIETDQFIESPNFKMVEGKPEEAKPDPAKVTPRESEPEEDKAEANKDWPDAGAGEDEEEEK